MGDLTTAGAGQSLTTGHYSINVTATGNSDQMTEVTILLEH